MSRQWRSRSSRLLLSSLLASYIIAIIVYGAETTTAAAPIKPEKVLRVFTRDTIAFFADCLRRRWLHIHN